MMQNNWFPFCDRNFWSSPIVFGQQFLCRSSFFFSQSFFFSRQFSCDIFTPLVILSFHFVIVEFFSGEFLYFLPLSFALLLSLGNVTLLSFYSIQFHSDMPWKANRNWWMNIVPLYHCAATIVKRFNIQSNNLNCLWFDLMGFLSNCSVVLQSLFDLFWYSGCVHTRLFLCSNQASLDLCFTDPSVFPMRRCQGKSIWKTQIIWILTWNFFRAEISLVKRLGYSRHQSQFNCRASFEVKLCYICLLIWFALLRRWLKCNANSIIAHRQINV